MRLGRRTPWPFSRLASAFVRSSSRSLAWNTRKMFSTTITAESTMMPKSTAPKRQEIGVFASNDEDDDAEEQREGNINADNDGAAQIAQKDPLNEENQQAAEDEVVQNGGRRDIDKPCAVVKGNELYSGRQGAVGVDFLDLGFDLGNDIVGVERAVHHQDRRDHIVVMVAPGFAEPWHIAHIDPRHVLDLHGHAVELAERDILDVLDLPALRQIGVAPVSMRPTPRIFTDCLPILMVRAPILMFALLTALTSCGKVTL